MHVFGGSVRLRKLPLHVLRPAGPGNGHSAADGGQDSSAIASLSQSNLQLCFATRSQVKQLKDLELALLRCWKLRGSASGAAASRAAVSAAAPPSILRGCFVRFVSQGKYRIDRIAGTDEDKGQLVLRLQGFDKPVPASCLSNTSSLVGGEWEREGQAEVGQLRERYTRGAAAAAGKQAQEAQPSCRELAAACCRLSTGWLWCEQLEAFREAVHKDLAAVAATLEDAVGVEALLPCIQPWRQGEGPPPAAAAGTAGAAGAAGAKQAGAAAAAAAADGSKRKQPEAPQGQQQQEQQQQKQQRVSGQVPPTKRQRMDSPAGSAAAAGGGTYAPGQSPGAFQQQQQQRAVQQQQAQRGAHASPQQPPAPASSPQQPRQRQQQQQQQQSPAAPVPAAGAPWMKPALQQQLQTQLAPGGAAEQLLCRGVAACVRKAPDRLWHQIGDLGNALRSLNKKWKQQMGPFSLAQMVWELHRRQLIRAEMRAGAKGQPSNVYFTNWACPTTQSPPK